MLVHFAASEKTCGRCGPYWVSDVPLTFGKPKQIIERSVVLELAAGLAFFLGTWKIRSVSLLAGVKGADLTWSISLLLFLYHW